MSLVTIGPTRTGFPEVLRLVHGLVDEPEIRGRRVRLAEHVVRSGRVRSGRRQRDHEVTHRQIGLEATTGPDTHDLLDAELDELLDHDCGRRASHPAGLHGYRLAVEGSGESEHPPLAVSLHDVVEEGLGDVLGAERVAGKEAGFGVIAGVGTNVNWHGAKPTVFPPDERAGYGEGLEFGLDASEIDRADDGADPPFLCGGTGRARLPRGCCAPPAGALRRTRRWRTAR